MAGILDAKSRVVDFILTNEGRRQVRSGDLNISFASFTDRDTFYEEEQEGVASDPTGRIYFESTGRYQDQIVVESNLGVITNFSTSDYDLNGTTVTTSNSSTSSLLLTGANTDLSNIASNIEVRLKNFDGKSITVGQCAPTSGLRGIVPPIL